MYISVYMYNIKHSPEVTSDCRRHTPGGAQPTGMMYIPVYIIYIYKIVGFISTDRQLRITRCRPLQTAATQILLWAVFSPSSGGVLSQCGMFNVCR